jgi:hypothetical protein
MVVVGLVVLGALGGGAVHLLRGSIPTAPSQPISPAAASRAADAAAPAPRARSAPPAATQSPAARLDAIVTADRAAAESLVDRWVPQIASKQVGTVDAAGVTFDEAAILGEVAALKARFPDAVVVRSDDFTSFRRAGFWVTLVASPSASADQANAWCVANGFAPADCFAKRLSHTAGPQGSTVTR